jgi:hypothetical protein
MLIASFVLSIIATATGAGALYRQIFEFGRSGPVVQVTAIWQLRFPQRGESGDVTAHIAVTTANIGRSPVEVSKVGLRVPLLPGEPERDLLVFLDESKHSLPYQLASGSGMTWIMPKDDLTISGPGSDERTWLAIVELAGGKTINSPITGQSRVIYG